jgi:hypothetical protein
VLVFTDLEAGIPPAPDFDRDLIWVAVDARTGCAQQPSYGTVITINTADI